MANYLVVLAQTIFITVELQYFTNAHFLTLNTECVKRYFNESSFVCACNATYCDELEPVLPPPPEMYLLYTSSKDRDRFRKSKHPFVYQSTSDSVVLTLDRTKIKQTIIGFGGSFTDSTGENILKLRRATQLRLLNAYFSERGIEYSLCRVPMGGTDFSPRPYTYDDNGHQDDFNLTHFRLAPEDRLYKIPMIWRALDVARHPLKLFASPWIAPRWMKVRAGPGPLRGEPGGTYYQAWADYFVRFLKAYKCKGINFWGVTVQNEPRILPEMKGFILSSFNWLTYTAATQRIFVAKNLGPTLKVNDYGHLKVMILDHVRTMLLSWAQEILGQNSEANKYVDGIATHWYSDYLIEPEVLDQTHDLFPEKFLLSTEACEDVRDTVKVRLGSWERGEHYASSILEYLQHWYVGWVDWNMALNLTGGFSWINNFIDSPIIVDKDKDEFLKQPMFYALGHFSKFVSPGSKVIGLSGTSDKMAAIAFDNKDSKSTVIVVINKSDSVIPLTIKVSAEACMEQQMPPRSFQTYVFWP